MNNELLQAFAYMFKILLVQPLLYWSLFFIIYNHFERNKREQLQFRYPYTSLFVHFKESVGIALLLGFFLSCITIGIGTVFTYEIIAILTIVTFILTILFRHVAFSVIYPVTLTFLLFYKLVPINSVAYYDITAKTFTGIILIGSILLIFEGILIRRVDYSACHPNLALSKRGKWFVYFRLKRIQIIPTLLLVPDGWITPINEIWPHFSVGADSYSLIIFPFITGFHLAMKSDLLKKQTNRYARYVILLGIATAFISILSYHAPKLTFVALYLALIGRIVIHLTFFLKERKSAPRFIEQSDIIKVAAVRPQSLAEQLTIKPGDIILRINDQPVKTVEEFDQILAKENKISSLTLKNEHKTTRTISSTFTCRDRYQLGIIVATKPYQSY